MTRIAQMTPVLLSISDRSIPLENNRQAPYPAHKVPDTKVKDEMMLSA